MRNRAQKRGPQYSLQCGPEGTAADGVRGCCRWPTSTKRAHARSICDEKVIIPDLHNVELSQARQAQLATSQKFHLAREMFEKSALFSLARLAPA